MGTTPKYGLPYPELIDPPDGPAQIGALASGVENLVYSRTGILAYTKQVSLPPMNQAGTVVDFTVAEWPRPAFNVPSSGKFLVTAGCDMSNINTATSTVYLRWRASAGPTFENYDIAVTFGTRMGSSKTFLGQGFTPGQAITLIPSWQISSGSAATAYVQTGYVIVRAVD